MLTICQYCKKRIHPARKEQHLKKCLQYRRLLRLNKIEQQLSEEPESKRKSKKKSKKD